MGELINGRTPEEIKAALDYCSNDICGYNDECAYFNEEIHCWGKVMKDALIYIQHLEAAQPKWISVEERLPWMNQKVLVSDGSIVTEAHYNGRGEWIHNGHDMEIGGVIVTHWMPMPQPPEEDM